MPCPYFYPEKKAENIAWNHNSRLPLGAGWEGRCCAPTSDHCACNDNGNNNEWPKEDRPSEEDLRNHCNLGYATGCPRLPREPEADAVRFGVFRSPVKPSIEVHFVRERSHLPLDHGTLVFDVTSGAWSVTHPNPTLQRQAECFLESWRARNGG